VGGQGKARGAEGTLKVGAPERSSGGRARPSRGRRREWWLFRGNSFLRLKAEQDKLSGLWGRSATGSLVWAKCWPTTSRARSDIRSRTRAPVSDEARDSGTFANIGKAWAYADALVKLGLESPSDLLSSGRRCRSKMRTSSRLVHLRLRQPNPIRSRGRTRRKETRKEPIVLKERGSRPCNTPRPRTCRRRGGSFRRALSGAAKGSKTRTTQGEELEGRVRRVRLAGPAPPAVAASREDRRGRHLGSSLSRNSSKRTIR
jgi:hypothetical protein